jgi:glycolate oxidase FAD binding subunit
MGLDVRWAAGAGIVLGRFGGVAARAQAESAERLLRDAGLEAELVAADEPLWQAQRESQRSPEGLVVRVSALQTDLEQLAGVAERHGATLVGRAGLGLFWLRLDDGDASALLGDLEGFVSLTLDRPAGMALEAPPSNALLARLKERFDPDGKLI